MTRRIRPLVAAFAAAASLAAVPAGAGEAARCAPGETDATAVQDVAVTGSRLYETRSGWGVTGDRGYLEVTLTEEQAGVHGRTRAGEADGRVLVGQADQDVCLNGTDV